MNKVPYLFDGYNVYHASLKLSEEWSHITPVTLLGFISADMRTLRDGGIVVFDGTERRGWAGEVEPAGFVKVVYSGGGIEADTRLEELIKKNTAPRRLVVVSTDRQVRKAARRRRAKSLSSAEYLVQMLGRSERPAPRPRDPREKRHGVADGELGEWLEMFGIDPEDDGDEMSRVRY